MFYLQGLSATCFVWNFISKIWANLIKLQLLWDRLMTAFLYHLICDRCLKKKKRWPVHLVFVLQEQGNIIEEERLADASLLQCVPASQTSSCSSRWQHPSSTCISFMSLVHQIRIYIRQKQNKAFIWHKYSFCHFCVSTTSFTVTITKSICSFQTYYVFVSLSNLHILEDQTNISIRQR